MCYTSSHLSMSDTDGLNFFKFDIKIVTELDLAGK